ncbi:MAG: 5-oxoprolinase subunit PxpB [Mesorhizobium sp.]
MKRSGDMRFLPVRSGSILVELDDLKGALSLASALSGNTVAGILEIVPAARTVLVTFDPEQIIEREVVNRIGALDLSTISPTIGPLVEIPVRYEGDDLAEVASMLGISEKEVVERHTGSEYTVAFTGFAPGFAYLVGGDPKLSVPRRKSPRTRVTAGSVGLAGEFSGVYPKDSPGGWQLIGSTPLVMFDAEREPAALLQPGFRVRFVKVPEARSEIEATGRTQPMRASRSAGARLEILSTMFPILFQDEGRPGQSSQGISMSGAADQASYRIANRLVGNKPGVAALEITLGQAQFKAAGRMFLALTGAPASLTVKKPNGTTRIAGRYEILALDAGDAVSIDAPLRGVRSYLAVRGGFDVQRFAGSSSRDLLAQIGPPPLVAGAFANVLSVSGNAFVSAGEEEPFPMPSAGETITLDVTLGPRDDWFTADSIQRFLSQPWTVTAQSSRVGLRLNGAPLERTDKRELPSEATVHGAIQVPANGLPLLFLNDHPVTGGYPVIANVARHHLNLAAQLPPGVRLRFKHQSLPEK